MAKCVPSREYSSAKIWLVYFWRESGWLASSVMAWRHLPEARCQCWQQPFTPADTSTLRDLAFSGRKRSAIVGSPPVIGSTVCRRGARAGAPSSGPGSVRSGSYTRTVPSPKAAATIDMSGWKLVENTWPAPWSKKKSSSSSLGRGGAGHTADGTMRTMRAPLCSACTAVLLRRGAACCAGQPERRAPMPG